MNEFRITTKECERSVDTICRTFRRVFNIFTRINFTEEESLFFFKEEGTIGEVNDIILNYSFCSYESIQNYSRIWFETDKDGKRYVKYIELLVLFNNVNLKNRERLMQYQIDCIRSIIITLDSIKSFKTNKIKTCLLFYKDCYNIKTAIYLPWRISLKVKENVKLTKKIDGIIKHYEESCKGYVVNTSGMLYKQSSISRTHYIKICMDTTFMNSEIGRKANNVENQQKYMQKVIATIKASIDA